MKGKLQNEQSEARDMSIPLCGQRRTEATVRTLVLSIGKEGNILAGNGKKCLKFIFLIV